MIINNIIADIKVLKSLTAKNVIISICD